MIQLLPPDQRAINHRRWSCRFSKLTAITLALVWLWNLTPPDWHPTLPEWGRYVVIGILSTFAVLAALSHDVAQPSLHDGPPNT